MKVETQKFPATIHMPGRVPLRTKQEVRDGNDDKAGPDDLVIARRSRKISLERLRHGQSDNVRQKEKGNVSHGGGDAGGVERREIKINFVVAGAEDYGGRHA